MSRAVAACDRIVKNTGAQDREDLVGFLAHEGLTEPEEFLDNIMAELAEENHRRDMIEIDLKVRLAMSEELSAELHAQSVEWKGMEDIKKEHKFLKKYFNEKRKVYYFSFNIFFIFDGNKAMTRPSMNKINPIAVIRSLILKTIVF